MDAMCFLRRTHNPYDASVSNDPDYSEIDALDPFLDGRSGSPGSQVLTHTEILKKIEERKVPQEEVHQITLWDEAK